MAVFWNVAPCSLVEIGQVSEMHTFSIIRTVSSKHLLCHFLRDYTVQHPRRQSSSYFLPWEPEISPTNNMSGKTIWRFFLADMTARHRTRTWSSWILFATADLFILDTVPQYASFPIPLRTEILYSSAVSPAWVTCPFHRHLIDFAGLRTVRGLYKSPSSFNIPNVLHLSFILVLPRHFVFK
jgi:hypothetical protein